MVLAIAVLDIWLAHTCALSDYWINTADPGQDGQGAFAERHG